MAGVHNQVSVRPCQPIRLPQRPQNRVRERTIPLNFLPEMQRRHLWRGVQRTVLPRVAWNMRRGHRTFRLFQVNYFRYCDNSIM